MFKDADQELARLEAELLKEEAPEEAVYEEEDLWEEEELYEDDDLYEEESSADSPEEDFSSAYLFDDTRAARGPAVYQNYSNNYGKDLRNYASGYRAYNSDACHEDLDAFSQEVLEEAPQRSNTGLLITACILAGAVAAVALFLLLWYWGVL